MKLLRRSAIRSVAMYVTVFLIVAMCAACGGGDNPLPVGGTPTVTSSSVTESRIDITWSEPITVADPSAITLSGDVAVGVETGNTVLTVTFEPLEGDTRYTLHVAAGAVRAKNGGRLNEDFSLSFTTDRAALSNPDLSAELLFEIDPAPVNPEAGAETRALYDRLNGWFGEKTLSGSMARSTVGMESNDWVESKTGMNTAIACFDFMNVNRWEEYKDWDRPYSEMVENALEWVSQGGIVSCMWHWRDPSGATDEFYCGADRQNFTTFDASSIFDPSSVGYKRMMDDIDLVSGYLKQLQDAGVAVLWRPLHEAEGNRDDWGGAWFWWGNGSGDRAAACVELWRVMYDRMVRVNGLNNLLWVWTNTLTGVPEWYDECREWYPGDDVVDIIGIDIYDENEAAGRGRHIDQFKKTAHTAGLRKMVALTECGYIPSAEEMYSGGDTWLWYMPWNGEFTERTNGDYWAESLADPRILTREDL